MIKFGNKDVTLYKGSQAVSKAYVGSTQVYPDGERDITPLCFTAEQPYSTVQLRAYNLTYQDLSFSTDDCVTWTPAVLDASGFTQTVTLVSVGDKVYWRCTQIRTETGNPPAVYFTMTGQIAASGTVMSMADAHNYETMDEIPYDNMFINLFGYCTALTRPPLLPATKLKKRCYRSMFERCSNLLMAPELPATELAEECYLSMFQDCPKIQQAPELPATTTAKWCYMNMFHDCTSLIAVPDTLPAEIVAEGAYGSMFMNCPSLAKTPKILAHTLEAGACDSMYRLDSSLEESQDLIATSVGESSCYRMYYGCNNLLTAGDIYAETLGNNCFEEMFGGCIALGKSPALHATELADKCYYKMFYGCKSLTRVPEMYFTSLKDSALSYMFYNCTSLFISSERTPAISYSWLLPTEGRVNNPSSYSYEYALTSVKGTRPDDTIRFNADTGIAEFYCAQPVVPRDKIQPLTFTARQPAAVVKLRKMGTPSISGTAYSTNGGLTWTDVIWDSSQTSQSIVLQNVGDKVLWRNNLLGNNSTTNYLMFVIDNADVDASGSVLSMLSARDYDAIGAITKEYAFYSMFLNNLHLCSAPEMKVTEVSRHCCERMYYGCRKLAATPDLPALYLNDYCYSGMFALCDYLTTAPDELPATTLAPHCYEEMFLNCGSIANAPRLPAPIVEEGAYMRMFNGCYSIVTPPALPAEEVGNYGYYQMFNYCTLLENAPSLPATKIGDFCYGYMFANCESLETTPHLLATELKNGCYTNMFEGCIHLVEATDLPAEHMAECCYRSMFERCTSLTAPPGINASDLAEGCYQQMFMNCSSMNRAPELHFTTLVGYATFREMFSGCTSLRIESNYTPTTTFSWRVPFTDRVDNPEYCDYNNVFTDCPGDRAYANILHFDPEIGVAVFYVANKPVPRDNSCHALCFENPKDGYNEVKFFNTGATVTDYAYSRDDGKTWTPINWRSFGDSDKIIMNNKGEKVWVKGNTTGQSIYGYVYANPYTDMYVSGNVLSILDAENYETIKRIDQSYCFYHLFRNQPILTAPPLPFKEVPPHGYESMFEGCTRLKEAPELPASIIGIYGYASMFKGCTALEKAPSILPAYNTLPDHCYDQMFQGCTSLTKAPDRINARVIEPYCCYKMFSDCSNLKTAPKMPELESIMDNGCREMFYECRNLEAPPAILAKEFAPSSCKSMFADCISMKQLPEMDFTVNSQDAFTGMFAGCTGVGISMTQTTSAPYMWRIPAIHKVTNPTAYKHTNTFVGCGLPNPDLSFNASTGIAQYYLASPPVPMDDSPLCITALEANTTLTLSFDGTLKYDNLEYSIDSDSNWTPFVWSSGKVIITLPNIGSRVFFRGNMLQDQSEIEYLHLSTSNKIAASGNMMSIYSRNSYRYLDTINKKYAFTGFFKSCQNLVSAPSLPATKLSDYCYYSMFKDCPSLVVPPELPATTLAEGCYECMFDKCTGLQRAPALPALKMAPRCYDNMFYYCTALKTAPALPATELAETCYMGMFNACNALIDPPALPALKMEPYCYYGMFMYCRALEKVPKLPATELANSCYSMMFYGCRALPVNTSSVAGSDVVWRIPDDGFVTGSYEMGGMFTDCAGSHPSSPVITGQMIFYTKNHPIS